MRHPVLVALCLGGTVALAGCEKGLSDAQVERAIKDVNVIDETNLNDVMLTVADPAEAVAYFQGAVQKEPDRVDLKRGLAKSLVRAQKPTEAAQIWTMVAASPEGGPEDRVMLADALIRSNQWDKAKAELNQIPPTHETFDRYRLEAMVADSEKNWKKSRQLLRNRLRADHETGWRVEQLGLFQADPRRQRRCRKAVHRGADLRSVHVHRQEQPRSGPLGTAQV